MTTTKTSKHGEGVKKMEPEVVCVCVCVQIKTSKDGNKDKGPEVEMSKVFNEAAEVNV